MSGTAPHSMTPLLAAALSERGQLDHRMFPTLAAQWLADGRSGDALLELASLHGDEREVTELWPRVLAEQGAGPPSDRRREAMAWGARLVADGYRDLRWLTRLLWPDPDGASDPELDELVHTLDDWLDWTDRDLRSRREPDQHRAATARAAMDRAVSALGEGDLPGASAELARWDG